MNHTSRNKNPISKCPHIIFLFKFLNSNNTIPFKKKCKNLIKIKPTKWIQVTIVNKEITHNNQNKEPKIN